ncbi:MAG: hypothetical protein AAGD14_04500 [Planctomycetota bacterium]
MRGAAATLLLLLLVCCARHDPEVERLLALLSEGQREGRQLAELGPEHADGIPAILRTMANDDRRNVQVICIEALLRMEAGREAKGALENAAAHEDVMVSDLACLALWKVDGARDPGLDRLVARASADPRAAFLLRRAPPLPPTVAAELAAGAELSVLAALGPAVTVALPRIEEALASNELDTRLRAAEAHYRVTQDPKRANDLFAQEFRGDNLFIRQRIYALWSDMLRTMPEKARADLARFRDDENEALRGSVRELLGG